MPPISCFVLTICVGFISAKSQYSSLKGDLVFVHILYRHGDRTPVEPYPTDPYGDLKYWPTGWGQLTNIGKNQNFQLGKWLRKRYASLLNDTYSRDTIYIQSTDVDRTLMSAESNLAGLYPPIKSDIWNKDINWQPIPIHTIPEKEDAVLAGKKRCPAYDYEMWKLSQSDEIIKLNKRFAPLYHYLTNHTGRVINSIEGVEKIYNTLYIEDLYNKTLPEWTKAVYPGGDMEWISALAFALFTYNRKLARLKCGLLLKEILQRCEDKLKQKLEPNRTMWIYSAHDTTVANLLNTLKVFEYHNPPYVACVMIELRIFNNIPYLSVFYKNTSEEPSPMFIPNCGISCPLNETFYLYNDVLPSDWESECQLSMLSMTYEEASVGYAMALLAGISLVILIFILIYACIVYSRRKSYFNYYWYEQINS